jgi:hypothetical protein
MHDQLVQYQIQRFNGILSIFPTIVKEKDSIWLQPADETSKNVLGFSPCPVAGIQWLRRRVDGG